MVRSLFSFFVLALLSCVGCSHFGRLSNPVEIPVKAEELGDSRQLLWVSEPTQGVQVQIQVLEKGEKGWVPVQDPMPAVVGQKGLADLGYKIEGDKKTPQGLFKLGSVFGKEKSFPTLMPYEQLNETFKWVDDPLSSQYNRLVRGPTSASSYETLLRNDDAYDLLVVLEYNTEPIIPGKGSAIFMHLWDSPTAGTAGCVALERSNLEKILKWLDPQKKPMILIGTSDQRAPSSIDNFRE